jgi:hypothetical protein
VSDGDPDRGRDSADDRGGGGADDRDEDGVGAADQEDVLPEDAAPEETAREGDPFADLGAVDRDGDPFESLGPSGESEHVGGVDDGPGGPETDRRSVDGASESGPGDADRPAVEESNPYDDGEFADGPRVERGGADTVEDPFDGFEGREGDPFEGDESTFERVEVEGVDEDAVWESLGEDGDDQQVDPDPDAGRYAEVSKHAYCEQCEFLSEPPEVRCTHEEAEIVEFLDMETVRVSDCPIVEERLELERLE